MERLTDLRAPCFQFQISMKAEKLPASSMTSFASVPMRSSRIRNLYAGTWSMPPVTCDFRRNGKKGDPACGCVSLADKVRRYM